eukprot:6176658-Pleurochrysis_carterae.AAC.1
MQPSTKEPLTVSTFQPSWDSSQISIRAWVNDVLAWAPTCDQYFARLIEQGYVLTSHGHVVATQQRACHCRLSPYLFSLRSTLSLAARAHIQPFNRFAAGRRPRTHKVCYRCRRARRPLLRLSHYRLMPRTIMSFPLK